MNFSEAQTKAICHFQGPAMVLAGPGSGKTLVITNRTRYLIEKKQIPPEEILVITFTRAAAVEMRRRFEAAAGPGRRVTFGTFHAVFFQILRYAYHFTAENIIREEERLKILSVLSSEQGLEFEDEKELLTDLTAEISLVKNEQIPLEHYYSGTCSDDVFRKICRKYDDTLKRRGLIDFDDMLVYTWKLLKERNDILRQWQKRFHYILVDEFQDINRLQYEVVKLLAGESENLFVVGDDDQSIYRFRGAKPEIMLGFQKDYPGASFYYLNDNFRSTGAIVEAASLVVSENRLRYKKEIRCRGKKGQAVEMRCFRDMEQQGLYLIHCIRQAVERGASYGDLAILTRTNTGGRYFAEKLLEFEIPFQMRDTMPILYDHWIAKDILTYIRMAAGSRDRKDFFLIMNRPKRYLSRECVDTQTVSFERLRTWYDDKIWMIRRIDKMEEDLHRISQLRPYAAVSYIRYVVEYEQYVLEYAQNRRIRKEELTDILDELQESARPFASFREWSDHIDSYRASVQEKRQEYDQQQEQAVTLSTLHSAKGLEFGEVFLPDLNEDIIPHRKARLDADIEEERRLLYVGMTRAKEKLHLFWLKERYGKKQEPSRFLEPLDVSIFEE